jgi:hypothetical protein
MSLLPLHQQNIDDFFRSIDAVAAGYQHTTFAYIAVKQGSDFVLIQGRIFFNTAPSRIPLSHFQSKTPHEDIRSFSHDLKSNIQVSW